jgi:hypothetical protein
MIQGCRYLRRSTDRWTLSKNSTTRLKDLSVWRKAGLLWECFDYNYIHPGFIFIPCCGMIPGRLRAQYLIPNLSPKCECLSIHSSLPLGPRHHAIPQNQREQSFCRTEAKLPTASSSAESFWRNLPSFGRIFSSNWAHKSDSFLYQILVLTIWGHVRYTPSPLCPSQKKAIS